MSAYKAVSFPPYLEHPNQSQPVYHPIPSHPIHRRATCTVLPGFTQGPIPMASSASLLNLPTEVRLIIWSYLFVDEWVYISPCNSTPEPHKPLHHQEHLPAIMRTCYELQQETAPVYYSSVHVHFDVLPGVRPMCLAHWLDDIGEAYARLVKNFQIRWNSYVDVSLELNPSGSSRNSSIYRRMRAEDDDEKISGYYQQHHHNHHQRLAEISLQNKKSNNNSIIEPPTAIHIAPTYSLGIQAVIPPPFFFQFFFSPKTTTSTTRPKVSAPGPLHHPAQFWKLHGTADFCRTLTHNLARELSSEHSYSHSHSLRYTGDNNTVTATATATATARVAPSPPSPPPPPSLSSLLEERMEDFIMGFVNVVDDHAQALRWLGYW